MGYEVLSAFFLEAGFLGVMLFGMRRVGKGLHYFATLMVAAGTLFSAFWILSANSWMQTPAGYAINEVGQFVPADWWAIVFNPSFPYRLVHMVLAAYLTTAFVVGAVGAFHLLKDRANEGARVMFSMALWMATLVAPVQIVAGDLHGLNTFEHQPAKVAAMEGHFETERGAPLILFGMPNMAAERTDYALAIPKLGSLILTHSLDGEVRGLKAWPPQDRPNAPIVFWSFRVMVAIGFLMALFGLVGVWLRWRGSLYEQRLVPALRRGHGACRLRRGAGGLDHHRGRPPALHGLRPAAHRGFGLAGRGTGSGGLARRVHRHLHGGVRRGHLLPPAPHAAPAHPGRARDGAHPDPHGRHHPGPGLQAPGLE